MGKPSVSIVLAVYNGLPFIAPALAGIRSQTYTDFEVIIVDDASTDGTWDYLQAAAAASQRMVLIRNERNLGVAHSRNIAIQHAQGALIACHDADDISLPERLARQVRFMQVQPEVGLLGTYPEYVDAEGSHIEDTNVPAPLDNEVLQRQLLVANCFCAGSVMMRGRLLSQVGAYRQELAPSEDYDLWLRLAEVTQLAILPERLYQYRQHSASASNTRRLVQMHNKALALEQALRRRYGDAFSEEHRETLAQDYLRCAYIAFVTGERSRAGEFVEAAAGYAPSPSDLGRLTAAIVERYIRLYPATAAERMVEALFAVMFPRTPDFGRVRQRLLAQVHLRGVYEAAEQQAPGAMWRHLWAGAKNAPRSLLAPGLLPFVARKLLRRSDKITMTAEAKEG